MKPGGPGFQNHSDYQPANLVVGSRHITPFSLPVKDNKIYSVVK